MRNEVKIVVTGDEMEIDLALIVCNHASLADHLVMAHVARVTAQKGYDNKQGSIKSLILPRINFFTWFSLWQIPSVRVFGKMLKSDENWELDDTLSNQLFSKVSTNAHPEWVILFPEVNIWTKEDAYLQQRQSEMYFTPVFQNLLYPRFSALANALSALKMNNSLFSKYYDVTIVYYRPRILHAASDAQSPSFLTGALSSFPVTSTLLGASAQASGTVKTEAPGGSFEIINEESFDPPSLLEIFSKKPSNLLVRVHVKSRLLSRVPTKRKKLEKWLENSWKEKDKLIDEMKETTRVVSE
ncbi:hypothetical protein BABINDRAFT_160646 [Babjeviella inositovora NRRL Y-12698]|uniref:Acyltransferase C-terminal domain-containing protein n=1 Tax=Babjeviella inositovora NRRL Y-12698 TaxID=984486 RepID=A0A1E3QUC3_9ASCO|nr:uncharacterized protein BABINDRAFT_160646 [Babjeviella inositovora NRRL Y-12698]ODQ81276.1 hypothetical protein BABINDRAFT_160646 [Babjeviella inositovora NRRL Y-12698]